MTALSQEVPLVTEVGGTWDKHKGCLYRIPLGVTASPTGEVKIAGFDMDSTLILSSTGEKYATSTNGWVWAYPDIVEKIQDYHKKGFTIVIFSNRKGAPYAHKVVQNRVDKFAAIFKVPLWAFLSTKQDTYRKPGTGMMILFCHLIGCKKYHEDSFYCGDAAGDKVSDPKGAAHQWNKWSSADSDFATAIGLKFREPHQIFSEWPAPSIPGDVNLVITCGQIRSGWDGYEVYLGTVNKINDGRQLVIIQYSDLLVSPPQIPVVDPSQGSPIYMILGMNPKAQVRDQLRALFGSSREKSIVYAYYRGASDYTYADKLFPKEVQFPDSTGEKYIRCN